MDLDTLMNTMPPAQVNKIMDGLVLTVEVMMFALVLIMWWWLWRNTPR